jgi:hypothetical protein
MNKVSKKKKNGGIKPLRQLRLRLNNFLNTGGVGYVNGSFNGYLHVCLSGFIRGVKIRIALFVTNIYVHFKVILKFVTVQVNWVVKSLRRYGPINFFLPFFVKKNSVVHSVGRVYPRRAMAWVAILVVLGLLESFLEIMEASQRGAEAPREINNNSDSKLEVLKEKRKTSGDPFLRQKIISVRIARENGIKPLHVDSPAIVPVKVQPSRDVSVYSDIYYKQKEEIINRFREKFETIKGDKKAIKILVAKKESQLLAIDKFYAELMAKEGKGEVPVKENPITEEVPVKENPIKGEVPVKKITEEVTVKKITEEVPGKGMKGEVPTKRSSFFGELWNKIKKHWGMQFDIKRVGVKVFPTFKEIGAIRAMEFYTPFERKLLQARERSLGEVLSAACDGWKVLEGKFFIARPLLVEERVFIGEFIRVSEIHREKAQESLKREIKLQYRELVCFIDALYANEELKKEVVGKVENARGMEKKYAGLLKTRENLAKQKASLMEHYGAESIHLGIVGEGLCVLNFATGGFLESVNNKIATVRVDFRVFTVCQETLEKRFGENGIIQKD